MQSNLKNIYENQYNDYKDNTSIYNYEEDENYVNSTMPVGWSFICLDEAINYYTDCNNKVAESHD
uniref:Uncharacterized protein n=1 Tax=Osmundaria fimbriata TaxID=228265 RepID=A0A1Z1M4V8_OSMFI|nr:hypothetical protein [Osmundaria fimbriata]ARW60804.1 hypothetical protein [Osmundaria fimbriata]